MTFPWMRPCRPQVLRSHGRRVYIDGVSPQYVDASLLRNKLEKAMPYLKGASLRTLIYEYWRSGEHFNGLNVMFRYYP